MLALADAMGMHVSEEAEGVHSPREIWEATLFTLLSKAGTTLSFLPIVLALEMELAIAASVAWGSLLVVALAHRTAVLQGRRARGVVLEHLGLTVLVVVAAHLLGDAVRELLAAA